MEKRAEEGEGDLQEDLSDEEDETLIAAMSDRERRLYLLRQKMQLSRQANHQAILAEGRRKKTADSGGQEGNRKRWYEERTKKQEARLKELGLTPDAVHRIETVEVAAAKHKKKEKKEAAFGWDVFNQKTLYKAYEKRANKVDRHPIHNAIR